MGFAAEFIEICSRNGSMTDPTKIGTSKDSITNSTEISSRRDHIADSAEIGGKDDHTMNSHARRTKLCQDRDQAQKHAAGYHSGGHKMKTRRTVAGGRKKSCDKDTGKQVMRRKGSVKGIDT